MFHVSFASGRGHGVNFNIVTFRKYENTQQSDTSHTFRTIFEEALLTNNGMK
jgi:hypothetical protein